jgi:Tyrosine phosphatase family
MKGTGWQITLWVALRKATVVVGANRQRRNWHTKEDERRKQWLILPPILVLSACSTTICVPPLSVANLSVGPTTPAVNSESTSSAAPLPKNFGIVSKGIYRGAQPKGVTQYRALRALGVTTILKLNPNDGISEESTLCRELGLEVIPVALQEWTVATDVAHPCVCAALREIKRARQSGAGIYIHCNAGKNRTGFLVGAYRELAEHYEAEAVLEELRAYGHNWFFETLYPRISSALRQGIPICDE